MEVQISKTSNSDFISTSKSFDLKISPENISELLLHSIVSEVAVKISQALMELNINPSKFSIRGACNPSHELNSLIVSDVVLEISFEGEGELSQYLNAVEISQYSSHGLATIIGEFVNVRWIATLNDKFIGDGIAHYYEQDIRPV